MANSLQKDVLFKTLVAGVACLAIATPLSVWAAAEADAPPPGRRMQALGGPDGENPEHGMLKIMDSLKLSPEQRRKIQAVRAHYVEQMKATREAIKNRRQELLTLTRAAKATREQAIAKQRELGVLQAKLAEARLNAWFEARSVLTPDQLATLEKLPLKRKNAWHPRSAP